MASSDEKPKDGEQPKAQASDGRQKVVKKPLLGGKARVIKHKRASRRA